MRQKLIEQAGAAKRSHGPQKVAVYVDQILLATSYCLTAMREIINLREGRELLPIIPFWNLVTPGKQMQLEQIKWIPVPVLARMADGLFRDIKNGLTMGVGLMLCMGLRTSEACAARIGELCCHDNYVTYNVRTQGADRTPVLKTHNAYRDVIAGKLLLDFVNTRREYLLQHGYTQEQIDQMPAVSHPDDPTKAVDSGDVSNYARSIMLAAGYSADDYNQASRLMVIEPDYEVDGSPMVSVAAYIFRRCYATMLCNYCDIMPGSGIEDYLLGHARKSKLPIDPQNPEIQRLLAFRMDRLVLHPEHTTHPLYAPLPLSKENPVADMDEHSAYCFVAQEDMEIEIVVETREANGTISITTDGTLIRRAVRRLPGSLDNDAEKATRPIVLLPPSEADFKRYLNPEEDKNFEMEERT